MADRNVRFIKVALQATYDALISKDDRALYWVEETQRLYCGNVLYGAGAEASDVAAGLLSAKDYALLQELIEAFWSVKLRKQRLYIAPHQQNLLRLNRLLQTHLRHQHRLDL